MGRPLPMNLDAYRPSATADSIDSAQVNSHGFCTEFFVPSPQCYCQTVGEAGDAVAQVCFLDRERREQLDDFAPSARGFNNQPARESGARNLRGQSLNVESQALNQSPPAHPASSL